MTQYASRHVTSPLTTMIVAPFTRVPSPQHSDERRKAYGYVQYMHARYRDPLSCPCHRSTHPSPRCPLCTKTWTASACCKSSPEIVAHGSDSDAFLRCCHRLLTASCVPKDGNSQPQERRSGAAGRVRVLPRPIWISKTHPAEHKEQQQASHASHQSAEKVDARVQPHV